jgi:predicted RNA-binding Zn-ribbon protein involved in translation (DUF1610 family)
MAGCIAVASIAWGVGAVVYVGLVIAGAIAILCLVQWKHSHQGADDQHGHRFDAPEAVVEASEKGISVRGPASIIGSPQNFEAVLKLAQRVVNKKALPPAHGYLIERNGTLEAAEYTESERANDTERARAEAADLDRKMRAALVAPSTANFESPTTAGALPSLVVAAQSAELAVTQSSGRVLWSRCEIISSNVEGDGSAHEVRCPACRKGIVLREQRDRSLPVATMTRCPSCGLAGDGNYFDVSR